MNQFDANLPWFIKRLGSIIKNVPELKIFQFLMMNYPDANSDDLSGLLSIWVQYIKYQKLNYADANFRVW